MTLPWSPSWSSKWKHHRNPRFKPQRDLLRRRRERRRKVRQRAALFSHQLTGKYIDDASNKPPAPSASSISDKPVTLIFNKDGPGSKPITSLPGSKAPAQISLGFSAEDFATEDDDASVNY
jgi:hypothetical protein